MVHQDRRAGGLAIVRRRDCLDMIAVRKHQVLMLDSGVTGKRIK